MATVREIASIEPIKGADRIELAHIDGWQVIVAKNKFKSGDRVVYAEIDSAIPVGGKLDSDGTLAERGTKTINGAEYHVLKTIKLRGALSQGLVFEYGVLDGVEHDLGDDVSEELGIFKYDPFDAQVEKKQKNQPADPNIIGPFPYFLRKTDSERVQNLGEVIPAIHAHNWVLTEKVDGQSITLINDGRNVRVCSRNYELAEHPAKDWALANGFLDHIPDGCSVQGEWAGPGINGNTLGLEEPRLFVFALLNDAELIDWRMNPWTLRFSVPILEVVQGATLGSVEDIINRADGLESTIIPGKLAEGIVFHEAESRPLIELGSRTTFKAISNKWLLKAAK